MNILLIETSNALCGVAVSVDGRVACELSCTGKKIHSTQIMGLIETALNLSQTSMDGIDAFSVLDGPGSYTGIRIGVSIVKALGQVQQKPCICVDSLEALAMTVPYFEGVICPMIDAKADHVFTARFRPGLPPLRITNDCAIQVDDYLHALKEETHERCLFIGDVGTYKNRIVSILGPQAVFANSGIYCPSPGSTCLLANYYLEHGEYANATEVHPRYLKRPNA